MKARLVLALLLIGALPLFAGLNRWTTSGPGVAAFSKSGMGLPEAFVVQIVPDPEDGQKAYALTSGAGVYRTSDAGQTWAPASEGLPNGSPFPLVAALENRTVLYTATGITIFASMDGGRHWARRGTFGGPYAAESLAADGATGRLYVAAGGSIFVSSDHGETWTSPILPAGSGYIASITVSSSGGTFAIAYSTTSGGPSQLLRSSDLGQTWTAVASLPSGQLVAADPDDGSIYVVGSWTVFVSHDNGQSWNQLPPGPWIQLPASRACCPVGNVTAAGSHIYIAGDDGAFSYDATAQAWKPLLANSSGPTTAIAITPSAPRRFYLAPDSGLLTRLDAEAVWSPAGSGLPRQAASAVSVFPSRPTTAYAASFQPFRTDDEGESWNSLGSFMVTDIEVSPETSQTAYALSQGIRKTTDGGLTWTGLNGNDTTALAVAPSSPGTLYAALANGMSKSIDGGQTWKAIMQGVSFDQTDLEYAYSGINFHANAVTVNRANSSDVYMAKDGGLYKTTDGGANWHLTGYTSPVQTVAFDDSNPSSAAYLGNAYGVFKTTDGGATWSHSGLTDKIVQTLLSRGSQIYAGTSDGHIYRSADGGARWTGWDDGLPPATIFRLDADPSGNYLYAATAAGVYDYRIPAQNVAIERLPDDPSRGPRLLDGILGAQSSPGFVLPVAGTVRGIGKTVYSTDITLTNNRKLSQEVLVTWLPESGSLESPAAFRLTLPPSSDTSGSTVKFSDDDVRFGIVGIGSMLVVAVDAGGAVDTNANISGSARIWSSAPGGRAPLSQFIPTALAGTLAAHSEAAADGLRHDTQFRTNVGITNLSSAPHQFTIRVNGERGSDQFTMVVPPFAMAQAPLPDGDYGLLALDVSVDDSNAPWLFYGTSIDRLTGDAQTVLGVPSQ